MYPHMKKSGFILTCASASIIPLILAFSLNVFCRQSRLAASRMLFSSAHTNASCELAAAFGVLADELKNDPDATGYIVIYNGPNDPSGLFHRHSLGARNVLVNEGHIDPSRITIIKGGSREEFLAEYWLVPKGASPPKMGPLWKPELQQKASGKFDEFFWATETEDLYEYRRASTQLDGFAQALAKNPDSVGYLIGYANSERVTRSYLEYREGKEKVGTRTLRMTGDKVAGWAKNSLTELFKIKPSRVVAIDGGYREFETVELWIVQAGEKAPKPTPAMKRRDK